MLLSPTPVGVIAFLPFHPPSSSTHSFLSFTPPPTPPPSSLKRTCPDSPSPAHLQPPNKKRRLRLIAPSSRLSAPFAQPTTADNGAPHDTREPTLRFPPPHTTYGPGFPRRPTSSLRHSQACTALAPLTTVSLLVPHKFLLRKAAILNAIRTGQIAAMRCRERQKQIMMAQNIGRAQAEAAEALDAERRKENGSGAKGRKDRDDREKPAKTRRKPAAKKDTSQKQKGKTPGNGESAPTVQTNRVASQTHTSGDVIAAPKSKSRNNKRENTSPSTILPSNADDLVAIPVKLKRKRRTKAEIAADLAAAAAMAAANRAASEADTPSPKSSPGPGRKKHKPPPAPTTEKPGMDPLLLAIPIHRRPPSPPSEEEVEAERRRMGVS